MSSDSESPTDDPPERRRDDDHLHDLGPDCGCAEVWERLSERRADGD